MSYFIILNEETKGPYTLAQLRSMWFAGQITGDTLYCEEGFDSWLHLRVMQDKIEAPASVDKPVVQQKEPVESKALPGKPREGLTRQTKTSIGVAMAGVIFLVNFVFCYKTDPYSKTLIDWRTYWECLPSTALLSTISMLIYFYPSYVGRQKRNFVSILTLNFFLGWTLVGWVVALVWANMQERD